MCEVCCSKVCLFFRLIAAIHCAPLEVDDPHVTARVEGSRLGHTAVFQCPSGYILNGTANLTCHATGNAHQSSFGCLTRWRSVALLWPRKIKSTFLLVFVKSENSDLALFIKLGLCSQNAFLLLLFALFGQSVCACWSKDKRAQNWIDFLQFAYHVPRYSFQCLRVACSYFCFSQDLQCFVFLSKFETENIIVFRLIKICLRSNFLTFDVVCWRRLPRTRINTLFRKFLISFLAFPITRKRRGGNKASAPVKSCNVLIKNGTPWCGRLLHKIPLSFWAQKNGFPLFSFFLSHTLFFSPRLYFPLIYLFSLFCTRQNSCQTEFCSPTTGWIICLSIAPLAALHARIANCRSTGAESLLGGKLAFEKFIGKNGHISWIYTVRERKIPREHFWIMKSGCGAQHWNHKCVALKFLSFPSTGKYLIAKISIWNSIYWGIQSILIFFL